MSTKLRVLCLHGYAQSAQKFRERTGPFRRSLKNELDLHFITAPHMATEYEGSAWWNRRQEPEHIWTEVQASLELIARTVEEEGPFDGVLGFSQGAGMAVIALAKGIKMGGFAILVAGFLPDMREFAEALKEGPISIPALVVIGETDEIVPAERGRLLAEKAFAQGLAQVLSHEGGHFLPCNAAWRAKYREFLTSVLLK
ncbi:hypothetical protein H4S07_002585 [Coemansia furcata]|uniref:Uncharacterized protein n=1 Tax=Coemansia furcata TaxID=417177 RepID=A0ACC1LK07_9FUNG|nr:hypothetical protein H4S07_002585 [Coemansia furcata]